MFNSFCSKQKSKIDFPPLAKKNTQTSVRGKLPENVVAN
jgi:hypothetical protein